MVISRDNMVVSHAITADFQRNIAASHDNMTISDDNMTVSRRDMTKPDRNIARSRRACGRPKGFGRMKAKG
jgi:hypothetical protein